ncbi:hypothetical protein EDB83DRAFT_2360788 [Lactarius deliciosus]|nr:hypothetical protein EDB83DRAFT_2360788 [Lactarius deliciosus]
MSFAHNSVVMGFPPRGGMNASRPQVVSATAPRVPPSILTYSYNSKLVYVTPGESYEQAIDFALESFPELRDVDRSLICLEVRVVLNSQAERKTARIGRMAWSPVVATLAQYEIVEIQVASPPSPAPSASKPLAAQPPPYASETGWFMEPKGPSTSEVSFGPAPSQQSHPCSFTTRVVGLFGQKSSRDHHTS